MLYQLSYYRIVDAKVRFFFATTKYRRRFFLKNAHILILCVIFSAIFLLFSEEVYTFAPDQ